MDDRWHLQVMQERLEKLIHNTAEHTTKNALVYRRKDIEKKKFRRGYGKYITGTDNYEELKRGHRERKQRQKMM